METAVKLEKLLVEEVSGVDAPANLLDGWMVAKSADGADPVETSLPEVPAKADPEGSATSPTTLGKIRELLFPVRKDDIEMTSEELTAALDTRDAALVEKFAEVVKSAVVPVEGAPAGEAPVAPEAAAPEAPAVEAPAVPADEATGLSVEDVTKAIQDAFEPYNEILEKTLDRIENIEVAFGIAARKSLEGQEDGKGTPVEKTTTPEDKAEGTGIIKSLLAKPVGSAVGRVERG